MLFVPDFGDGFPLYPEVFAQYFKKDRPDHELLIYLPRELSAPEYVHELESILSRYEARESYVTLQTGETLDEHILFQNADYFVTTRCRQTVYRTCLADLYQVKILYGTDEPIFCF